MFPKPKQHIQCVCMYCICISVLSKIESSWVPTWRDLGVYRARSHEALTTFLWHMILEQFHKLWQLALTVGGPGEKSPNLKLQRNQLASFLESPFLAVLRYFWFITSLTQKTMDILQNFYYLQKGDKLKYHKISIHFCKQPERHRTVSTALTKLSTSVIKHHV